ncbi:T6SS immunity protein Tli4 family protein [Yersinia intermedia]|uniref:T6SS immunity protein Tli4 family protein n=1 Tax=Yersinia intermedia TaxID=631 RepID=UPI0030D4B806
MKNSRQLTVLPLVMMGMIHFSPVMASTFSHKDNPVIDSLFSQTKPQCIGRYVIDVPQSFDNQLHNMIFIDDFKIESKFLYFPAFKQRIVLREKALREQNTSAENSPVLKEVIRLSDEKGVIFDSNRPGSQDSFRRLEAHIYVDHVAFIITTDILDLSSPKYAKEKKSYLEAGFTEAKTDTRQAKLSAMQSLISRLSGRKDEDIPTEKGVCIPNGFIKDDGSKHSEKVSFSYKNDDFILGLYTNNTFSGSSDTLLNRSAQIDEAMKVSNQFTIKKGELSPDGIPSQEWLSRGKQKFEDTVTREDEVIPTYDFTFYANEAGATSNKPWLTIGISNDDIKTSYSEAQMIEIWDRLVNSLRYKR